MAEETPEVGTPETGENTGGENTNNTIIVPSPDVNINIPEGADYSSVLSDISSGINTLSDNFEDFYEKIENASEKLDKVYDDYNDDREEQKKKAEIAPQNYWDILRHQYFGMALQAVLTRTGIFTPEKLTSIAADITDAAIKKMKNTPFTPIE